MRELHITQYVFTLFNIIFLFFVLSFYQYAFIRII